MSNTVELAIAIAKTKEAFDERFEHERKEILEEVQRMIDNIGVEESNNSLLTAYTPTKLDHIGQYLHLLYEAQRVDHNVHNEIDEALKQFKREAGITGA